MASAGQRVYCLQEQGLHLSSLINEDMSKGYGRLQDRWCKGLTQQASCPTCDHNCLLCSDLLGCGQGERAQGLIQVAVWQYITFHLQQQSYKGQADLYMPHTEAGQLLHA